MRLGDNSPCGPKTYSATDAPEEMLDLARRLIALLLGGDHPTCALLQEQYATATFSWQSGGEAAGRDPERSSALSGPAKRPGRTHQPDTRASRD
jgi:hypothetical protein